MTFLEGPDDLQWLSDVHRVSIDGVACAILWGNEDCPDRIELYARNNVCCKPTVLERRWDDFYVVQVGER